MPQPDRPKSPNHIKIDAIVKCRPLIEEKDTHPLLPGLQMGGDPPTNFPVQVGGGGAGVGWGGAMGHRYLKWWGDPPEAGGVAPPFQVPCPHFKCLSEKQQF